MKILIPAHFEAALEPLTDELGITLVPYDKHGFPMAEASGASAMFRWWISEARGDEILEQYRTLRWIHTGSAGVDHILTPAFRGSGITLTNSAGVHADSIAEWVIAAMLSITKTLPDMAEQQMRHVFEKVERDELTGQTIVILGGGHIAAALSKRLMPFGMKVIAVNRRGMRDERFTDCVTLKNGDRYLSEAAWLIVTLPLTSATSGLIDAPFIDRLPAECRIVNVARGEIIDEKALIDAIERKRIAGAVLDVFSTEPLPQEHPFWSMPGVMVLPHTTWRSPKVRERQLALFTENLSRFVRGQELVNVVDVEAGY